MAEHRGSHGSGAGSFGHKLLLLEQGKYCRGNLVVAHCNDFIDILPAKGEGIFARLLHGDAVGYGRDAVEMKSLAVGERTHHGGCPFGLHAVDLDVGAQRLHSEGNA